MSITHTALKRLIIATLITIIFVSSLTWFAFQPPPGRPNITVTFLGYTNDAAGTQLASFAVSNLSASAIYRQPYYFIQMPAPAEPAGLQGYQPRMPLPGASVLRAGTSETFSIPAATNRPTWRLYLHVYPDTMPVRAVKQTVAGTLRSVGMKPRYRVIWYAFYSDWIESKK